MKCYAVMPEVGEGKEYVSANSSYQAQKSGEQLFDSPVLVREATAEEVNALCAAHSYDGLLEGEE